jgi:hypothetical protein
VTDPTGDWQTDDYCCALVEGMDLFGVQAAKSGAVEAFLRC